MYACIPPFPLLLAELGAASIAPCKLHTHTQGHLQMWSFLWSVETAPASCCTTPEDWSFVWSPSGSSTGPRGSLCLPPRVHTRPSPTRDLPCSCVLHANCGTGRVSQATPFVGSFPVSFPFCVGWTLDCTVTQASYRTGDRPRDGFEGLYFHRL